MATITKVQTPKPNVPTPAVTGTTIAAGDFIKCDFKDEHTMFWVHATTAGDIVLEAGNGYAANKDLPITVPAGDTFFTLESSFVKKISGENKGMIKIKSKTAAGTIAIIEAQV